MLKHNTKKPCGEEGRTKKRNKQKKGDIFYPIS
jgi:hypothetical protein